jgi:hypothetical protein
LNLRPLGPERGSRRLHRFHRSTRSVNLLISLNREILLDRTRRTPWHPTATRGLRADCGQEPLPSPLPVPSSSSRPAPSWPSGRYAVQAVGSRWRRFSGAHPTKRRCSCGARRWREPTHDLGWRARVLRPQPAAPGHGPPVRVGNPVRGSGWVTEHGRTGSHCSSVTSRTGGTRKPGP